MKNWWSRPLKLRSRLTLAQSAAFLLLALVVMGAAYAITLRCMDRELDAVVRDHQVQIRRLLALRRSALETGTPAARDAERLLSDWYYQVVSPSGELVGGSEAAAEMPLTAGIRATLHSHRDSWETIPLPQGAHLRVVNSYVAGDRRSQPYLLRVGIPTEAVAGAHRRYEYLLLLLLPVVLLVHAGIFWRMMGQALDPLSRFAAAAQAVTSSDLVPRFPAPGSHELNQVSTALNDMLGRLRTTFDGVREFVPNLAHELRRPMTILRAECELALRGDNSKQEYREVLANQLLHIEMLNQTMSNLMELTQTSTDLLQPQREYQDVSRVVRLAVNGMLAAAAERGITLTASLPPGVMADVEACKTYGLVLNLIDNAVKYNRRAGCVHVALAEENGAITLSVSDTGQGIPADDLPHIFERSYRAANACTAGVEGTGLGLFLAKSVIEEQGGRIEVSSTERLGSCFRVVLPHGAPKAAAHRHHGPSWVMEPVEDPANKAAA